jgi:signal transduction histidine kinase
MMRFGEPHWVRHEHMKQKPIGFSQRYVTALRKHLKQGLRAGLQPASRLGHEAVALGLKTLELARIHEEALVSLELSNKKSGLIKRAEIFFTEAIVPIVETDCTARQGKMDLNRVSESLGRRTVELAATNRQLQRSIVRRKSVAAALKRSGIHYGKLLKESLQLQEGLRQLAHRSLSAQEQERLTISHQLQDEIAQTLLGINVRLLSLRTAASGDMPNLTKEIASAQRLVEESVRSINRFARELNLHQPA